MTKRERVEDLGVLKVMLQEILDNEIFAHTNSKHGYEQWFEQNIDKDGEVVQQPVGLYDLFSRVRGLRYSLEAAFEIAVGDDE